MHLYIQNTAERYRFIILSAAHINRKRIQTYILTF